MLYKLLYLGYLERVVQLVPPVEIELKVWQNDKGKHEKKERYSL
jgi:hypothetical protein